MFVNESVRKWNGIITEELGVKDPAKLNWMSQYAAIHEIHEGLQSVPNADAGIYATPLNTVGMGNPAVPFGVGYNATSGSGIGNTGADFHSPAYAVGSGDALPMSTLPMALNVAAMTIGLELVPVIPAQGPWQMLSYMDYPYAGGKLARFNETAMDGKGPDAHNKPIYVKVSGARAARLAAKSKFVAGDVLKFVATHAEAPTTLALVGKYIGTSRIDSDLIVEVKYVCAEADIATASSTVASDKYSIADVFDGATKVMVAKLDADASLAADGVYELSADKAAVRPDFVATMVDHIPGFANFFDGSDDLMTRAQNETGVGNTIGARMFSKLVQIGAVEVTGTVTRQQLQDMPLYGVDVVGKVLEAMQNELSQHINKDILTRLFALGVTNALEVKDAQGADLNLFVSPTAADTHTIPAGLLVGVDGVDHGKDFGNAGALANISFNTSAENITTWQRRIMSRVLAASNIIAQVGRRGRATWVVCNTQIVSALQDAANFVVAPMVNSLTQDGSQSLYFAGSIAGLNVYVDPYMPWSDSRICVGRKGDGNGPGVIFLPYILADSVSITAEGTMAPKLLLNSRYAVVDAGFFPETNYFTFYVFSKEQFV